MNKAVSLIFILASLTAAAAVADTGELDPDSVAPQGLVVRSDAQGNRVVFKAAVGTPAVKSDADAAVAVATSVKPENKIADVIAQSELDRVSSSESWYYWYGYNSYYYGYYYYGYSYYYRPCYNWNYGGYYYNYYYRY